MSCLFWAILWPLVVLKLTIRGLVIVLRQLIEDARAGRWALVVGRLAVLALAVWLGSR